MPAHKYLIPNGSEFKELTNLTEAKAKAYDNSQGSQWFDIYTSRSTAPIGRFRYGLNPRTKRYGWIRS